MTDETPNPIAPEQRPMPPPTPARPSSSADTRPRRPDYRGEELDPERGPGLGCFWFQVIVLGFFIVLIPIGINLAWPYELLAILLFIVLGLLLFTGQTVIFLLRLVAADRRAQGRRRPLASPTKTVGELEDEHGVAHAVGGVRPAVAHAPAAASVAAASPAAEEPPVVPASAGTAAGIDEPETSAAPRASRAMIRDLDVVEAPATDPGVPETRTASARGAEAAGDDASAGARARAVGGGAALAADAAGVHEGPPAERTQESSPDGQREGRAGADVSGADSAAGAADGDDAAEPAAGDADADPGEPPEEPDPGVRQ